MNKKKTLILSIIGLIGLIIVTIGITYAVFTYTKLGTTDNTVTSGTLKFLYTENTGVKTGIKLTNALPISDTQGKALDGDNNVFDFSIEATNTGTEAIPYEVTLRRKDTSTLAEENAKVYLTDRTESQESSILEPTKYSELTQTNINVGNEIEKTIYSGTVNGGEVSYRKDFRLRMWIDEQSNQTDINGKEFTAMVNVYANAEVITVPANTTYSFNYTGSEETFVVPATGKYKLEVWGAQGGSYNTTYRGGYGGYSTGVILLNKNDNLYVNVGGKGVFTTSTNSTVLGGYNGGGKATSGADNGQGSGGGATHIATKSGVLSNLEDYKGILNQNTNCYESTEIIIVAAGGGGATHWYNNSSTNYSYGRGGDAGGFVGNDGYTVYKLNSSSFFRNGTGGTQTSVGLIGAVKTSWNFSSASSNASFGTGGYYNGDGVNGGGSGFYGGGCGAEVAAGGGSGYIGNSLLTNKVMYCYNCQESSEESTKTISTTDVSEEATSNYAKIGNGYVRITYLGK